MTDDIAPAKDVCYNKKNDLVGLLTDDLMKDPGIFWTAYAQSSHLDKKHMWFARHIWSQWDVDGVPITDIVGKN